MRETRLPIYLCELFMLLWTGAPTNYAEKIVYKVGALFRSDDTVNQVAFKLGLEAANELLVVSGRGDLHVVLEPVMRNVTTGDPFKTSQEICKLLKEGVVAIAGPEHNSSNAYREVHSLTHRHGIPHIFISWGVWNSETGHHFAVNTHPSYNSFGRGLKEFIVKHIKDHFPNKFRFSIIYKEREALLKYEELLNNIKLSSLIRQWKKQEGTYEYVLKYFNKLGEFNFLVDIPCQDLQEFFKIAHDLNMTREYYNYYITTWDADRINFAHLKKYFYGANVTSFTLIPEVNTHRLGHMAQRFVDGVVREQRKYYPFFTDLPPTKVLLLYDALQMFAYGILQASKSRRIQSESISCYKAHMWGDGATLMNYIRSIPLTTKELEEEGVRMTTFSGPLSIDVNGFRDNYKLTIEERLPYSGLHNYGYWAEHEGLIVTKNYTQTQDEIRDTLRKKTLYVTTIIDEPFVFYKHPLDHGEVPSTDPEYWDGFCIALLKNISQKLGFKIAMHLVRDGQYGKILSVGSDGKEVWNGMIGELMNRTADMAIASLTITYDRERVIDFTTPFMSLGLSIIYRKPEKKKPSLFSFLHPLSKPVWGYMLAAYIMVSVILFTVARFSPFEWYNPHACLPDSDIVENQFNINNSLWFTIGSLMQQGSELAPRANSTRLVSGSWWFFTLIMISSYTANLAAFLTVERMKSPIENVDDLSKQNKIKYGIIEGGATYRFFEKATIPTYKRMFEFMTTHKAQCLVKSTHDGINRVSKMDYAFILESTMNEYYSQRNCRLMQVGGLLDSKGYGIGMPSGSPYVDVFSETILELQKSQIIEELRQYWWRKFKIDRPCDDDHGSGKTHLTNALGLEQVGGAFIILTTGMVASIFGAFFEFFFKYYKTESGSCAAMWKELRFAIQCCVSNKRRHKKAYPPTSYRHRYSEDSVDANINQIPRAETYVTTDSIPSGFSDSDCPFSPTRVSFLTPTRSRSSMSHRGFNGDLHSTKL